MRARATGVVMLAALYLAMLPAPTPVDLLIGLGLGLVAVRSMGPSPLGPRPAQARLRFRALARLLVWVVADVAEGTWRVATAVVGLRPPHEPGVVLVPLPRASDQVLVVMGVLLTISPGTVLVRADLEAHSLLIHVVDGDDESGVRRRQEHLHGLVRAAVGE